MGHTNPCGEATGTECACSCGGSLHGVAGGALFGIRPVGASAWDPEKVARAMGGVTRPAVAKRLSSAVGSVAEYLVERSDISRRLGEFAGRIVERQIHDQPKKTRRDLRRDEHLICGLLARMARDLARVASLSGAAGEAAADMAFPGQCEGIEAVKVEIMKAALKKVIAKTFELAGTDKLNDVVRVLRCAALAACPDIDSHQEVREHCEAPLTEEVLTEATRTSVERIVGAQP